MMKPDLIEQWKRYKKEGIVEDNYHGFDNLIEATIEALSPVLPDDVAKVIHSLRCKELNYAADMLERQQRDNQIQPSKESIDSLINDLKVSQQRIEEYRLEHNRNVKDLITAESRIEELEGNESYLAEELTSANIEITRLNAVLDRLVEILDVAPDFTSPEFMQRRILEAIEYARNGGESGE